MANLRQKFIGVVLPFRLGNNGMFDQSTTLIEQTRSNFKNLILTKKGERISQPQLGCDLWKIALFSQLTPEVIEGARISVIDAVTRWLPYLELLDFQIQQLNNSNTLSIKCLYRFRNNPNVTDSVTIQLNGSSVNVTLNDALTKDEYTQAYGITTRTVRGSVRGFEPEV